MKKISDASSEEIAFIEEHLSEWQYVTLEQLLEISKYLRIGVETVRGCILCAEIVCAGLVLWSSIAITRAWRKKVTAKLRPDTFGYFNLHYCD